MEGPKIPPDGKPGGAKPLPDPPRTVEKRPVAHAEIGVQNWRTNWCGNRRKNRLSKTPVWAPKRPKKKLDVLGTKIITPQQTKVKCIYNWQCGICYCIRCSTEICTRQKPKRRLNSRKQTFLKTCFESKIQTCTFLKVFTGLKFAAKIMLSKIQVGTREYLAANRSDQIRNITPTAVKITNF